MATHKIGGIEIKPSYKLKLEGDPRQVFEILDTLGQGAFGTVWKAKNTETDQIVALKQVIVEREDDLGDLLVEIEHMSALISDYIVAYHGGYLLKNSSGHGYSLWIEMEYCAAGSVSDLMEITDRTFTEEQISVIMRHSLCGLKFLHDQKRLHRDIKAGNIMLNDAGRSKLGDFGVSGEVKDYTKHHTVIGTPFWMAPEVIQGQYDSLADIWSLGITAIELAEGKPPFFNIHPMRFIFMIPTQPPPKLSNQEKWSPMFHDFVAQCLTKDPANRPTAERLLKKHPFIKAAKKVRVKKLFTELLQEAAEKVDAAGSRKTALGLDTSSECSDEVERGSGSTSSGEGDYNSGTCVYSGTMVINEEDGYSTTKITGVENSPVKPAPQFQSLLGLTDSKRATYEAMSTDELMETLNQIDAHKNAQLATLKRNYELDTAILEELKK